MGVYINNMFISKQLANQTSKTSRQKKICICVKKTQTANDLAQATKHLDNSNAHNTEKNKIHTTHRNINSKQRVEKSKLLSNNAALAAARGKTGWGAHAQHVPSSSSNNKHTQHATHTTHPCKRERERERERERDRDGEGQKQ